MKETIKSKEKLCFRHKLGNTIQGFVCIVDNLVMMLTFSYYMPNWTIKFIVFRMSKGKKYLWGKS